MTLRFWPLARGFIVTSGFGYRTNPYVGTHWGTDFGRDGGSGGLPVYTCQGGTVVMVGAASGFGQWVVVDHPTADGGGTTVYGHIIPEVPLAQRVEAGQRIARINPDSNTNGGVAPHLHLELHRSVWSQPGPDRLDPLPWLSGATYPGETPSSEPTQGIPGMTAETFSKAMGGSLSLDRYRALLPAFTAALRQADCTTADRVAMLCAQVGHESSGLRWMEEIADGSAYEGRADLGNTQGGDGRRFKGHGPIQITGRFNHTQVSKWAHGEGLVPTPTYFVDNPNELGSDRYGFLGVVWYWTVARNMNAYADRGDIVGATRAVNGGTNGLEDRIRRWNLCRALGAAILPTEGDDELMGIKFTNDDGHEVDAATALYFIDKHLGMILDQLGGPGTKSGADWPGWDVLGGDTVVEFLGKLNARLSAIEAKLAKS